jgi:hypothetical protein
MLKGRETTKKAVPTTVAARPRGLSSTKSNIIDTAFLSSPVMYCFSLARAGDAAQVNNRTAANRKKMSDCLLKVHMQIPSLPRSEFGFYTSHCRLGD